MIMISDSEGSPGAPSALGAPTIVTNLSLELGVPELLRGQGVDPGRASRRMVALAEGLVDEVRSLVDPAAIYAIFPVVELDHQRVTLDNGVALSGPLVSRALAGATHVALAVCTAGPALEARVQELFDEGDAVRAVALDGAGNAAASAVGRLLGAVLCDEATARGLRTGMLVNPGQEGWPLAEQRTLFDLVPAGQIGVYLTPSCLMLPRKSVSFAVGLGPGMREDAVPCDFCSRRDHCKWRRENPGGHS